MVLRLTLFAGLMALSACTAVPRMDVPERRDAALPATLPPMAQFALRSAPAPERSNAAIARDILDLSFQMESGREITRLSRFEGPITVAVVPGAPASLGANLDRLLARLRREARIDISRVSRDSGPASIVIETLPRSRMQRVVPQAACFVVPRVSSWNDFRRMRNGRDLDWTTLETRQQIAVFIPSDVPPQEIRDCLHEEVSQAIGPLNDLYRLSDSVFNDDNFNAVLTGFDMLVLRAYNDPALRSGMTRAEAAAALPGILARLNPRGNGGGLGPSGASPRAWIDAIETALGRGSTNDPRRIAAARQAVAIARSQGWQDNRLAFSYFALGRLSLTRDPDLSLASFLAAGQIYRQIAPGGIHMAHVKMQLAAFALSSGQAERALELTGAALPAATQAENASLLATLLMIRAEALDLTGRPSEARAVRLDSLGWGRYGFGRTDAVEARLNEIAGLVPRT
ncbi:DUF2927 domain-containing protein [Rhodophyticola porphyridii]